MDALGSPALSLLNAMKFNECLLAEGLVFVTHFRPKSHAHSGKTSSQANKVATQNKNSSSALLPDALCTQSYQFEARSVETREGILRNRSVAYSNDYERL